MTGVAQERKPCFHAHYMGNQVTFGTRTNQLNHDKKILIGSTRGWLGGNPVVRRL